MIEASPDSPAAPPYTSRIIKASALIADTTLLLAEWDLARTVPENLDRVQRQNILGKSSRSRIEDILPVFRQRYFDDPDVGAALVALVQGGAPAGWLDPLLYFFTCQNDRTLRDLVVEVLYPRHRSGYADLPVEVLAREIRNWVAQGKTTTTWGEATVMRVAQGAMATLRDFGVLQGKQHKRITPVYLAAPAFALIACWLHRIAGSGDLTVRSEEWQLFFLQVGGVERLFIEADQEHLLTYHAAGSLVRIDFPAASLAEYAHALLARAYQSTRD